MNLTILFSDLELDEQRRFRRLQDRIERLERAGRDATELLRELGRLQGDVFDAA